MHTISHFAKEQFAVSNIVDRDSYTEWQRKGSKDTAQRAHDIVKELLSTDIPKVIDPIIEKEIDRIVRVDAKKRGISETQIPQEFFVD
jgi:trimethylamine:corrinoid methyltransferase-like protein